MASKKKTTETTAPLATKEEVEGAIRDVLAGDPSAAEAIVAKAQAEPKLVIEVEGRPDVEEAIAAKLGEAAAKTPAKRSTAKPAAKARPKAAAKAKTATPRAKAKPEAPEVETPDLTKALLDGLAAEGIEARAVVSPKGNFYRVEIDEKTTIAFVNYRAKGALRIEPRLVGGRAPKGFTAQEKVRQGLGFVATIATEKEIALAVAALKLAAEKAREGKAQA
jgi:hypothetical protein